jgi:hypothetical protein
VVISRPVISRAHAVAVPPCTPSSNGDQATRLLLPLLAAGLFPPPLPAPAAPRPRDQLDVRS